MINTAFLLMTTFFISYTLLQKDEKCFIFREDFDKSAIRNFLDSNVSTKSLARDYSEDTSDYSIFFLKGNKSCFISVDTQVCITTLNGQTKTYNIDTSLISITKYLSSNNTVLKLDCSKDFVIYGGRFEFSTCWIKNKNGDLFVYYANKCDVSCLDDVSDKQIAVLIELERILYKKYIN